MMTPFRYCDSSDVIVTLFITIFYIYLIQLWRSFFQIFVDGNALYAQTREVLTLKKKTIAPHFKSSFFFNFVLSGFLCGALGRWWNRLLFLAHADDLFYPLFLFGVYTGIGKKTGCYLPLKKREETGPN